MAMKSALMFFAALGVCSCFESDNDDRHEASVYFGTVKDTNTGTTLLTFCRQERSAERSRRVAFSAEPGSFVEEEVLFEMRQEYFPGAVPPDRDEAFWCSAAPETFDRMGDLWICLRSVDGDPPATLLAIEPRGNFGGMPDDGSSSGYALKLEVRHPGVLHLAFDIGCRQEHADPSAPNPYPDGTLTESWGELTIQ